MPARDMKRDAEYADTKEGYGETYLELWSLVGVKLCGRTLILCVQGHRHYKQTNKGMQ